MFTADPEAVPVAPKTVTYLTMFTCVNEADCQKHIRLCCGKHDMTLEMLYMPLSLTRPKVIVA